MRTWLASAGLCSMVGFFALEELKKFRVPKYPVFLCHGFMGQKWLYFYGVREQLEDYGCLIHVTEVNPIAGVESRGRELADQIVEYLEQHKDVSRVNLIGHSMGGLDARVAAHLLKNNEIASITTISSPHHGSELALIGGPSEKEFMVDLLQTTGIDIQGIVDLSPQQMALFNETYPPLDSVKYFSVAGSEQIPFSHPLYLVQQLLYKLSGDKPNDGLVTVESAKYGEFLAEYPKLNHWSELGWTFRFHHVGGHVKMYDDIVQNLVKNKL